MRFKSSKILYAYWDELRGSRIAPRRFEIEPSRIADILPETFILEKVAAKGYRYRLAGTRVCDRLGEQYRGMDFLSCWGKKDRAVLARDLDTVSEHGAVLVADVEARYSDGPRVKLELLILPLLHTHRSIDRYMGLVCASSVSCGLGQEPLASIRLKNTYLHWPVNEFIEPVADMSDKQSVFKPHVRHSRVVRVNRRSFRVYEGGLSHQGKDER